MTLIVELKASMPVMEEDTTPLQAVSPVNRALCTLSIVASRLSNAFVRADALCHEEEQNNYSAMDELHDALLVPGQLAGQARVITLSDLRVVCSLMTSDSQVLNMMRPRREGQLRSIRIERPMIARLTQLRMGQYYIVPIAR